MWIDKPNTVYLPLVFTLGMPRNVQVVKMGYRKAPVFVNNFTLLNKFGGTILQEI